MGCQENYDKLVMDEGAVWLQQILAAPPFVGEQTRLLKNATKDTTPIVVILIRRVIVYHEVLKSKSRNIFWLVWVTMGSRTSYLLKSCTITVMAKFTCTWVVQLETPALREGVPRSETLQSHQQGVTCSNDP